VLVSASAAPPPDTAAGDEDEELGTVAIVAPPAGVLFAPVIGELLAPLAPQAVSAPASPTRPTPASMPRRVASDSWFGSCVTTAPFPSRTTVQLPYGRIALPLYRGTERAARWFTSCRNTT
jgi:hypothetical protein